jgi:uncharacterized membrane-anchored protein
MKNTRVLLFIILALVQIGVAGSMIVRREMTLHSGRQFRLRLAPVNPYDAFRGRYLQIRIDGDTMPYTPGGEIRPGETVYASIREGSDGFARLHGVSATRPAGDSYFEAQVIRISRDQIRLGLPFDRYYVAEDFRFPADAAGRKENEKPVQNVYATVRIRSGYAVLEGLYLEGKPASEYLRTLQH